jgi:hypothetical protein
MYIVPLYMYMGVAYMAAVLVVIEVSPQQAYRGTSRIRPPPPPPRTVVHAGP